jgi:hypothetical protein
MHAPMPHIPRSHHHLRFYLIAATLLVGGIFLLLVYNDDGSSVTGAVIADELNQEQINVIKTSAKDVIKGVVLPNSQENIIEQVDQKEYETTKINTQNSKYKKVDMQVSFNKIPDLKNNKAEIESFEINFNDLSTTININDDRLELSNLEDVIMYVEEFKGEFRSDETTISIDGEAKKITINDISLSSKSDIKLSFAKLEFNKVNLNNIQFDDLNLPNGDGNLQISQKLDYELDNEEVEIGYFDGDMNLNDNNQTFFMSGVGQNVFVTGDLVSFRIG